MRELSASLAQRISRPLLLETLPRMQISFEPDDGSFPKRDRANKKGWVATPSPFSPGFRDWMSAPRLLRPDAH
ncbi:MAG: hypothetical protein AAGB04_13020, partial [Pseudomonadota bacterium]